MTTVLSNDLLLYSQEQLTLRYGAVPRKGICFVPIYPRVNVLTPYLLTDKVQDDYSNLGQLVVPDPRPEAFSRIY